MPEERDVSISSVEGIRRRAGILLATERPPTERELIEIRDGFRDLLSIRQVRSLLPGEVSDLGRLVARWATLEPRVPTTGPLALLGRDIDAAKSALRRLERRRARVELAPVSATLDEIARDLNETIRFASERGFFTQDEWNRLDRFDQDRAALRPRMLELDPAARDAAFDVSFRIGFVIQQAREHIPSAIAEIREPITFVDDPWSWTLNQIEWVNEETDAGGDLFPLMWIPLVPLDTAGTGIKVGGKFFPRWIGRLAPKLFRGRAVALGRTKNVLLPGRTPLRALDPRLDVTGLAASEAAFGLVGRRGWLGGAQRGAFGAEWATAPRQGRWVEFVVGVPKVKAPEVPVVWIKSRGPTGLHVLEIASFTARQAGPAVNLVWVESRSFYNLYRASDGLLIQARKTSPTVWKVLATPPTISRGQAVASMIETLGARTTRSVSAAVGGTVGFDRFLSPDVTDPVVSIERVMESLPAWNWQDNGEGILMAESSPCIFWAVVVGVVATNVHMGSPEMPMLTHDRDGSMLIPAFWNPNDRRVWWAPDASNLRRAGLTIPDGILVR